MGMIIIAEAILESGIGAEIGVLLKGIVGHREKLFVVVVYVTAAFLSAFANNSAIVALFMPFIASLASISHGHITKKNTYLPLAMGSLVGGTGTLVGCTAPLLASEVLVYEGLEPLDFFTPAPIAIAMVAVIAICFWLFLYDFMKKSFYFPEVEGNIKKMPDGQINKRNAALSISVFLVCIVLFMVNPFNWDIGLIAITGAFVLILTGCVDIKKATRDMPWPAVIVLGAALAMAKGFVSSGAGNVVVDFLMSHFSAIVANPVILVGVFLFTGFILSQFMSNGSLVSMLTAIGVPIALQIGCDPIPVALACVYGCSLAMATPVATTSITIVQVAGYRFKDYLRIGGITGLIGAVTAWVCLVVGYGLI
ncbi:MAG: anion permease [Oscillospiraceae bacterium]|nr:anion permease [Oscillospiraceae bacterium]